VTKRHGGRQTLTLPQTRLTARQDEILTRSPLLQASAQMETGWDAELGPRPSRWWWPVCPPLRPMPKDGLDLTGRRWGRLTVAGLLDMGDRSRSGRAAWVVRCDCGRFETRTARSISRQHSPVEACTRCDYVRHIRRKAVFDRTGAWPADYEGFE
jgi:hypothetical protein